MEAPRASLPKVTSFPPVTRRFDSQDLARGNDVATAGIPRRPSHRCHADDAEPAVVQAELVRREVGLHRPPSRGDARYGDRHRAARLGERLGGGSLPDPSRDRHGSPGVSRQRRRRRGLLRKTTAASRSRAVRARRWEAAHPPAGRRAAARSPPPERPRSPGGPTAVRSHPASASGGQDLSGHRERGSEVEPS